MKTKTAVKERVMSEKGFLFKSTTKAAVSAGAFLQAHKAWLLTGDLAALTAPILAKVDSLELQPTPALEEIRVVVLDHMIATEILKGALAIAKREEGPQTTPKNWVATIYNSRGEVCTRINSKGEEEEQQKSFNLAQEADGWVDRRLFEGASDWFGVINHTIMTDKDGDLITTEVMRADAIARILKLPKAAVMRKVGGTTSSLSFRPKARNDVAKFSHG
jgi:hypothetical protein